MFLLVHFSFCPIGIVYCVKSGQKLPIFSIKKIKIKIKSEDFIRIFGMFCDISFILTLILARKLSFRGGN